jgi:hypothetical protein
MCKYVLCCAAVFCLGTALCAGELDGERSFFKSAQAPAVVENEKAPACSEMDGESPQQSCRWGWSYRRTYYWRYHRAYYWCYRWVSSWRYTWAY